MSTQEYAPYRGCNIEVHVTLSKTRWLGGKYRRYRVSWTVTFPGNPEQEPRWAVQTPPLAGG
ncbi:hypothetical protein EVC45_28285 [Paraburkholderia sp. UYCP14C]|nr:hypothetical protein EVC45_28285 [Paraburkholderia sp. UYCP14C]